MAWLCVEYKGSEYICSNEPKKMANFYVCRDFVKLPKGTIKKLIGKELTWKDKPVELLND